MELVSGILSNTAVQPDVVIYNAAISACVDSWLLVFHAAAGKSLSNEQFVE